AAERQPGNAPLGAVPVVPTGDAPAEPDRKRLDIHAAPAGGEVMAQFVEEDENAQYHHEGGDGAGEVGEKVRQGCASFRSARLAGQLGRLLLWFRRGVQAWGSGVEQAVRIRRHSAVGDADHAAFAVVNVPAARRASSSKAMTCSSVAAAGAPSASRTRSTVATISKKPIRRCRKASTATSLAALRIAGVPPPARKASPWMK